MAAPWMRSVNRGGVLLLLATALLAAPAREGYALQPHVRDGWVAGIGFGLGRGVAEADPLEQ